MQCESCKTEFSGDTCPKCGLKQKKVMCLDCFRKFYKPYLKEGLCPECFEKEVNAGYKDPITALCFSIVPGLGHYYLGLKNKGGVFLFMFFLSAVIPLLGWVMLPVAYLFPAYDAYRTAKRMNVMDEVV